MFKVGLGLELELASWHQRWWGNVVLGGILGGKFGGMEGGHVVWDSTGAGAGRECQR